MTINNSHKPIGSNVRPDSNKLAGTTYGERRELGVNKQTEQNIARPKDFFNSRKGDGNVAEVFSSNTQYLGTRKVLPHKVLESGKGKVANVVTDDVRLSFLDRIISGSAENRPPKASAAAKSR